MFNDTLKKGDFKLSELQGPYTITVKAIDLSGNIFSKSVRVRVKIGG